MNDSCLKTYIKENNVDNDYLLYLQNLLKVSTPNTVTISYGLHVSDVDIAENSFIIPDNMPIEAYQTLFLLLQCINNDVTESDKSTLTYNRQVVVNTQSILPSGKVLEMFIDNQLTSGYIEDLYDFVVILHNGKPVAVVHKNKLKKSRLKTKC